MIGQDGEKVCLHLGDKVVDAKNYSCAAEDGRIIEVIPKVEKIEKLVMMPKVKQI